MTPALWVGFYLNCLTLCICICSVSPMLRTVCESYVCLVTVLESNIQAFWVVRVSSGLKDDYNWRTMKLLSADQGTILFGATAAMCVGWTKVVSFAIGCAYGVITFYTCLQVWPQSSNVLRRCLGWGMCAKVRLNYTSHGELRMCMWRTRYKHDCTCMFIKGGSETLISNIYFCFLGNKRLFTVNEVLLGGILNKRLLGAMRRCMSSHTQMSLRLPKERWPSWLTCSSSHGECFRCCSWWAQRWLRCCCVVIYYKRLALGEKCFVVFGFP